MSFELYLPTTVVANFTPLAPNLAASVSARTDAGTNRQVVLSLANTGLGNASNATITGISASAVLGTGAVSVVSHLPVDIGTIAPGATGVHGVPVQLARYRDQGEIDSHIHRGQRLYGHFFHHNTSVNRGTKK